MPSAQSSSRLVIDSETIFWNKYAERCQDFRRPGLDDLSDPFVRSSNECFFERIGPVDGRIVLDVGCGLGGLSLYLAQKGANVIGIDLAEGMVTRCGKRSSLTSIAADFILGDAQNLPLADQSVDLVVGMRAVHHFPELRSFFLETRRILRPGGRAVFVEPQKKNPIVEVNRRLLNREDRTLYEHPLVPSDIECAAEVFPSSRIDTFYLISPAAFLFRFIVRSKSLFECSSRLLQAAERRIARRSPFAPYCWQVVLSLSKESI